MQIIATYMNKLFGKIEKILDKNEEKFYNKSTI